MKTLGYCLVLAVSLALDLVSDIVLRPVNADLAHEWDITTTVVAIAAGWMIWRDRT